jgi:hypothetical protein
VRHELYGDQPDRHPALTLLQVGELLPWKGSNWRVASIRESPMAAVILVPVGETKASKLGRVRELRRTDRILSRIEAQARADAPKYAAAGQRKGA